MYRTRGLRKNDDDDNIDNDDDEDDDSTSCIWIGCHGPDHMQTLPVY